MKDIVILLVVSVFAWLGAGQALRRAPGQGMKWVSRGLYAIVGLLMLYLIGTATGVPFSRYMYLPLLAMLLMVDRIIFTVLFNGEFSATTAEMKNRERESRLTGTVLLGLCVALLMLWFTMGYIWPGFAFTIPESLPAPDSFDP